MYLNNLLGWRQYREGLDPSGGMDLGPLVQEINRAPKDQDPSSSNFYERVWTKAKVFLPQYFT